MDGKEAEMEEKVNFLEKFIKATLFHSFIPELSGFGINPQSGGDKIVSVKFSTPRHCFLQSSYPIPMYLK